ncbi:hypothetical protein QBC37DRAFT_447195 [Rhypophila decipiens]|uniref:Uncharacterized protein n=1 Tax=Rhypophila decipiens TaxID=261697 RepID=A0AAN6Y2H1_9PEZI|nr:hypothetical protein QBC37DRAFT_447195 [Rhypophila decipiens]
MAPADRAEVLDTHNRCLETLREEFDKDTIALSAKIYVEIHAWKERNQRRVEAEKEIYDQLSDLEPTEDELRAMKYALGGLIKTVPSTLIFPEGDFHVIYKRFRESKEKQAQKEQPSGAQTASGERSANAQSVRPPAKATQPARGAPEAHNEAAASQSQNSHLSTAPPPRGSHNEPVVQQARAVQVPDVPTSIKSSAKTADGSTGPFPMSQPPSKNMLDRRGQRNTNQASHQQSSLRRTGQEITTDEVKKRGYWVFEHGSTKRRVRLFTLRCPSQTCRHRVFSRHPFYQHRAARHFRECGITYNSKDDLIRRFAQPVVPSDLSVPVTRLWAKQHNDTLIGSDRSLVKENAWPWGDD